MSWKSEVFTAPSAEIGLYFFLLSLVLFTAERQFTRHGRPDMKSHTQHSWAGVNSHRIIQLQHFQRFVVNVWMVITGDELVCFVFSSTGSER